MLNTPLLHAKGVYEVESPWVITPGTIYECIAIRSFKDLEKVGQSVFDLYYNTQGLDWTTYNADRLQNANIVTLSSPTAPTLYVPDTYIKKFPDLSNVAYKLVILAVDMGPMPDYVDLTFLKDQIQGVVSNVIGVTAEVKEHIAPSTGVVSESEHEALEAVREAAITLRQTDYAALLKERDENVLLKAQLDNYETIWKAQGQLPP